LFSVLSIPSRFAWYSSQYFISSLFSLFKMDFEMSSKNNVIVPMESGFLVFIFIVGMPIFLWLQVIYIY